MNPGSWRTIRKILDAFRVSVTDAEKQYKDVHTNLNSRTRGTSTTRSAATSVRTATPARVPSAAQLDSTPATVPTAMATAPTTPVASCSVLNNKEDLAAPTPSTCSTICVAGDTSTTTNRASPTTVSTILPFPVEIEDVHDAVDLGVADLASSAPTTCSAECPSVYAAALTLSATPNSSTTTGGIVPELAAPELSDMALDVDVMGDTSPTAAICLPGDSDHNISGEDHMSVSLIPGNPPSSTRVPIDILEPFMWSGPILDTPPSVLAEAHKVINDVPTATAFVPWPPPSGTCATPLIRGQDLCHDAQQKRGKKFLVSFGKQSLVPLMQEFTCNQGKLTANWREARQDRHHFEGIKVVTLQMPWLSSLGLCLNLLASNFVFRYRYNSSTLIAGEMRPVGVNLEQHIMAKLATMDYMVAHTATLHRHFPSGNLTAINTDATNCAWVQYLHCKGPQSSAVPILLWFQFATQSNLGFHYEVREDSRPYERRKVVKLKLPWPPSLDSVLMYLNWENSIAKDWCSGMSFLHPSDAICEASLGFVHVLMADPSEHDKRWKRHGSEEEF